jgi:26S proteasome regulatory subunit T5
LGFDSSISFVVVSVVFVVTITARLATFQYNMSTDDLEGDDIWGDAAGGETKEAAEQQEEEEQEQEDEETRHFSIGEIRQRIHLLNNEIRIMKSDVQRITHESRAQRDRIRENQEKVKLNKQLPYLVANVVEVLEPDAEDGESVIMGRA